MKSSLGALRDVGDKYQKLLLKITKSRGLTIAEWQLLKVVMDGFSTQESLSKKMKLDTSTLSRQLKKLLQKEMIQKKAVGKDKRQLIYTATKKGIYTCGAIDDAYNTLKQQVFDEWTEEEENNLWELLRRLRNSLESVN